MYNEHEFKARQAEGNYKDLAGLTYLRFACVNNCSGRRLPSVGVACAACAALVRDWLSCVDVVVVVVWLLPWRLLQEEERKRAPVITAARLAAMRLSKRLKYELELGFAWVFIWVFEWECVFESACVFELIFTVEFELELELLKLESPVGDELLLLLALPLLLLLPRATIVVVAATTVVVVFVVAVPLPLLA